MSPSTSGTFEPGYESSDHRHSHRRGCGWARKSWSFWEIALIAAAFIVFWPLGLLALFWKLAKGELWTGSSQSAAPWSRFKGQDLRRWAFRDELTPTSGNSAFDAYKKSELERLELARATALSPEFLLLDEPTSGMSDAESLAMVDRARAAAARIGAGVLVIDHDLAFITRISHHIVVLNEGSVLAEGSPEQVRSDPAVAAAYLGSQAQ